MRRIVRTAAVIVAAATAALTITEYADRGSARAAPPRIVTRPAPTVAPAPIPPSQVALETKPTRAPLTPAPPVDGRDAPDPFVLRDSDRWALYTTQVGFLNVPVAVSADLATWSAPIDALPKLPTWAARGWTWAPGVLARRDGFVLYFAARSSALGLQCIGVASASSATGPFAGPDAEPLVCQSELGGSIDPYPFVDRDGTAYLLWKSDENAFGHTSHLYGQRLRPDGLALEGDAVFLLANDAQWESPLIENPAMLAEADTYALLYSGGWWESAGYGTGYATCTTPLGPCLKVTTQGPMLGSAGSEAGTGGACVITGPAGDHWLAYHAWSTRAVGYGNAGVRTLRFAELGWDGDALSATRSTS
jgi:beta-xylosidase